MKKSKLAYPKRTKINDSRKLAGGTQTVIKSTVTTEAGFFFYAFQVQNESEGVMALQVIPAK